MPFPVEEKYIIEAEIQLKIKFPPIYRAKMIKMNGGELEGDDYFFMLHPFLDKSSNKRISRTCNDIVKETKSFKKWDWEGFPEKAVVIGDDNSGNRLLLIAKTPDELDEAIYFWNLDGGKVEKIAENILELGE